MYRQISFASKFGIKILGQDGAHIVPMAHPIICKQCEQLNIWLFKVKTKLKKVIITFADSITYLHFSYDSLTTFMPSLFGMFIYSEFLSNVTRRLCSGISFTLPNFFKKILSLWRMRVFPQLWVEGGNRHHLKYMQFGSSLSLLLGNQC